jgi:hypothetical protein
MEPQVPAVRGYGRRWRRPTGADIDLATPPRVWYPIYVVRRKRSRDSNLDGLIAGAQTSPSEALLTAALSGLIAGTSMACGTEATPESTTEKEGAKITSQVKVPDMTFAKFSADCDARGGLVQTHAVCAGNNSCKGVSFNKYDLILSEHTCKAQNTCGGMSCVELAEDKRRPGVVTYAESCGGCHGGGGTFHLPVPPGTNTASAAASFSLRSAKVQVSIVAFGIQGHNASGSASANMPAHYDRYSRAEIEGVVDYIRSLPVEAEEYGILGETEDIGSDGR